VKALDGSDFDLSQLKGKKVLIVIQLPNAGLLPNMPICRNFTSNTEVIVFTIIGFPANNFLHQEPGTNEEIASFCKINYGVTFPMMEKISVKGKDIHPLYAWLTQKSQNGVLDAEVSWNFQKFMIDEKGHIVDYAKPSVNPLSNEIISWITEK
jgi:glutathione peroxidase